MRLGLGEVGRQIAGKRGDRCQHDAGLCQARVGRQGGAGRCLEFGRECLADALEMDVLEADARDDLGLRADLEFIGVGAKIGRANADVQQS